MYANLTREQRDKLIEHYNGFRHFACDAGHAVACAAHDVLCPANRAWNGKRGADAFAAALASLVMDKIIEIKDVVA